MAVYFENEKVRFVSELETGCNLYMPVVTDEDVLVGYAEFISDDAHWYYEHSQVFVIREEDIDDFFSGALCIDTRPSWYAPYCMVTEQEPAFGGRYVEGNSGQCRTPDDLVSLECIDRPSEYLLVFVGD